MNWWIKQANDFEDMFGGDANEPARIAAPEIKPVTLTLYRGFDADMTKLERQGDSYILNPARCEQGVLWFSCPSFQNDAIEVASRGKYLLTYQLPAKRHVQEHHYQSGPPSVRTPDYFHDLSQPTENSRYHAGYELPDGWEFSYKVQKFIICKKPILVTQAMITERGA